MRSVVPFQIAAGVFLLVNSVLCSGCYTWTPINAPIPEDKFWSHVRIARHDSTSLTLADARVVSDTVIGFHTAETRVAGKTTRIPLNDVRSLERRKVDVLRTTAATAATLASAAAMGFLILYYSLSNVEL
jgi:hypothetical protein